MNTDPQVRSLVQRWQELQQQGQSPTVTDLCAGCPELSPAVQQELQALASMEAFLERGAKTVSATRTKR